MIWVLELGLHSMQGREAKYAKLACYAKNTTKGRRLRWWQIFKHEFMELIWLKEKHHLQAATVQKNKQPSGISLYIVKATHFVSVVSQNEFQKMAVTFVPRINVQNSGANMSRGESQRKP